MIDTLKRKLRNSIEQLKLKKQELQHKKQELFATYQELQTITEELHATNQELETSQDELLIDNKQQHQHKDALCEANGLLENILASLQIAVVVVDRDLHIQLWNAEAENLWGLRSEEVKASNFMNLDIGLPVEQLRQRICLCLAGKPQERQVMVEAINHCGRAIKCKVTLSPLMAKTEIYGVILLIEKEN
jgi:two-component system CheB/CheR fusion protein